MRVAPLDGEDSLPSSKKQAEEVEQVVYAYSDHIDPASIRMATVDPNEILGKTFLLEREVDGSVHRAEVIKCMDDLDFETDMYLVDLGDGKRQDIMSYVAISEAIDRQLERENAQSPEDRYMPFKSVVAHKKTDGVWQVRVKWQDDSESWEPLSVMRRDDPVTLAVLLWTTTCWTSLDGCV
jgi:hypothetical protein